MLEKYKVFTGLFFGALWVLLTYGFISEELLPPLLPLKSFVFVLCDLVFLCLGIYTLRARRDVLIFISFFFIAVISSKLNNVSFIHGINGARDFFGLIFAVPFCRYYLLSKYRNRFIASVDKQLWFFLFLQAFCLVWQFIRYGANDHGGGSMGNGYSGIVSTLIYIISFYFISKKWTFGNYWQNLIRNKIYFILLFPSFLNETKISFIFLLSYFLLLLPFEWKTVFKVIISIPLIIIGMLLAGYVYLTVTGQEQESVFTQSAMSEYFTGGGDSDDIMEVALAVQDDVFDDEDVGMLDIPRFLKIALIPDAMMDSEGGIWLGAGLGQFKGGTVVQLTSYADRWQSLLSGTIHGILMITIQLGLCGMIWIFFNFYTLLLPKSPLLLGKNIKIFIWLILILAMLYNDSLRFFPFCMIVFYIALRGYENIPEDEIKQDEKNRILSFMQK